LFLVFILREKVEDEDKEQDKDKEKSQKVMTRGLTQRRTRPRKFRRPSGRVFAAAADDIKLLRAFV
jgi:hypothetical protein